MKKVFTFLSLLVLAFIPFAFVGCKSTYDNLSIDVESSYEIVLGENENDSLTIVAKVDGARDTEGQQLAFSIDNERLVRVSQEFKNGNTYLTLKALAPGLVNVEARTLEGGVTKNFVVNIVQPIVGFSAKEVLAPVEKGEKWTFDCDKLLNLEPINTTQKNFALSFAQSQDLNGLSLENNVLTVSDTYGDDFINLIIESIDNPAIAPKTIKLNVIDKFNELTVQEQSERELFHKGDVVIFEKNSEMISKSKVEELNIISNLVSQSEKSVIVRVYSSRDIAVNCYNTQNLQIKQVASSMYRDGAGNFEYIDFEFSIRFFDGTLVGAVSQLKFEVSYKDFDYSLVMSPINVYYDMAPQKILVNDDENNTNFTIYNFYSISKKGQKLQFGILPSSVSRENCVLTLKNSSDLVNVFNHLQFYRNNGERLENGDEILSNEIIYCRSNQDTTSGTYELLVESNYVNPETNTQLAKTITFNVMSGITSLAFEDEEQINLQINSINSNSKEVSIECFPGNVDLTKIFIGESDGLNFSNITLKSQTQEKAVLKFTVNAQKTGKYSLKVFSENGFEITKQVEIIESLESVRLNVDSANQNSIIGERQIVNSDLYFVALSIGGSATLYQMVEPINSNYRIEYSYFESEVFPEFSLSSYNYSNTIDSSTKGLLDYGQLLNYSKLVALREGYAVIKANYIPLGVENDEFVDLQPITKYFIVQGYYPIKSIVMSSNYANLYSLDSVGVYKKDLTMTKLGISVYPQNATYANNLQWSYDKSGEYFTFDEETMVVTACKKYSGMINIVASINEFGRSYSQTFALSINDAKTVSDIQIVGVGDEIYIENTSSGDKSLQIIATAFPRDAYNTKIRYDFVDNAGNISNEITISDDGFISIPEGIGAKGYIRIASEDCFQENPDTSLYEHYGINGKNVHYIPITIANGTSKETAIYIYTKEELSLIDTTKHYYIVNDLDVSGIHFENLSGGLYGREERTKLTGLDQTFIKNIDALGHIQNLEFEIDIESDNVLGLIAEENYGEIYNVILQGTVKAQEVAPVIKNYGIINAAQNSCLMDGINVGGIVLENRGEIKDCSFTGSITAKDLGAGIAVYNHAQILNSKVLLLYESLFKLGLDKTDDSRLSGFVVTNFEDGTIEKSYIYSYGENSNFSDQNDVLSVGFVFDNFGRISQCFASLNVNDSIVTGFVRNNNINAIIENCYSNSTFIAKNDGNIEKCYSVEEDIVLDNGISCYSGENATEKNVAQWLRTDWDISCDYLTRTIWKIYLDTQNPILTDVQEYVKPESLQINIVQPTNNNKYIVAGTDSVILYFYQSQTLPLSIQEKSKLNQYNSYSIYDIFDINSTPIGSSNSPDMFSFSIEGEDKNIIDFVGGNIVVKGLGKQTIKITSKLNPELYVVLNIYTMYPIRNFNIYKSTSALDPSDALTNDSIIYLKRTYTQALYSKISNKIVLIDREIELITYQPKIVYGTNDSQDLGLFLLSFDNMEINPESEDNKNILPNYLCSLDFSNYLPYEEFDEILSNLSSIFSLNLQIHLYNGAEQLSASVDSIEMEPIDTINFDVVIVTDIENTENQCPIDVRIYKITDDLGNGIDYTEYFNQITTQIIKSDVNEKGFYTYLVKLQISLIEKNTQISGNYRIKISPNEPINEFKINSKNVELLVLPQSLQRIDYSHYYATSRVENNEEILEINSQPSNALAPGQYGLLELNLFPTYSQIDRVEIYSIENQGFNVKMQLYSKSEFGKFKFVSPNGFSYLRLENGISVSYSMIKEGSIYLKTQIASNIPQEMEFVLKVLAYASKDDQNPKEQYITLVAKFIPSATMTIDGEDTYVVMGRGTSKAVDIVLVGEGEIELSVSGNSNNSAYLYQRAFLGSLKLDSSSVVGSLTRYNYSSTINIGSCFEGNTVYLTAVVYRDINGVRERRSTTITIKVVDFVINSIKLKDDASTYSAKVGVQTALDFVYDIDTPQSFTNEEEDVQKVEIIKSRINTFKNSNYFSNIEIGFDKYIKRVKIYNQDGSYSSISQSENEASNRYIQNDYVKFEDKFGDKNNYLKTIIEGIRTGGITLKVEVSIFSGNDEIYTNQLDFDVSITNYSTEDKPIVIKSLEDFNEIFNQAEPADYILMSDIEISNLVPYQDTSLIRSLDGNGYKIIIKSFDLQNESNSLNLALFNTINDSTTLKNIIIDNQVGIVGENGITKDYDNIEYAGLAIINEGIITNCHILSRVDKNNVGGLAISQNIPQSANIKMAGMVITNNGSITNSRVGGTSYSTLSDNGEETSYNLSKFNMIGQDEMAGFVLTNSGIIANSYVSNVSITNNSDFVDQNITAGFVVENNLGAKISGCYVKGTESSNTSTAFALGEGIASSGVVSGFVYMNKSQIHDSYSKIKLYNQNLNIYTAGVRSAGFVYQNDTAGEIVSCLAFSPVIERDSSQKLFCGVDQTNTSLNKGVINYSYYYTDSDVEETSEDVLGIKNYTLESNYYGYNFTTNGSIEGIWYMTSRGPELVSANNITLSRRYLVSTENNSYILPYVVGYEYGSKNNPILIRTAQEFNEVFGNSKETSISNYYDTKTNTAFGSYRLINDIDLNDLNSLSSENVSLISTKIELTKKTDSLGNIVGEGYLDGNSMTISNLDVGISNESQDYFGLFKSLTNGAVIKNLNVTVKAVSASNVSYVGALCGLVDDSKVLNVNVEKVSNQTIALVQGKNVVGGVVGVVSGQSTINNISSNVSAYSTYLDSATVGTIYSDYSISQVKMINELLKVNSNVSFAGAVAGAIYCEDLKNKNNLNINNIDNPQINKIKVYGRFSVNGKVVGGAFGYVGKTTFVRDVWLCIEEDQKINAISDGIAGGLVGVNYGKLSYLRTEYNSVQDYSKEATNLQVEIENAVADYYDGRTNTRKTYEGMFADCQTNSTIGSLVGESYGGRIMDSYSKLDAICDNASVIGGLVGVVKSYAFTMERVYTFANVQSLNTTSTKVGGLFGYLITSSTLNTVVGVNYLDKNMYSTNNFATFYPFASLCKNVPVCENIVVLEGVTGKGIYCDNNSVAVSCDSVDINDLFPASNDNILNINKCFNISENAFIPETWTRNYNQTLPHLIFNTQEIEYIIDSVNTANDIRKIFDHRNATFVIEGIVEFSGQASLTAAINLVRGIDFSGVLYGRKNDKDEEPVLVNFPQIFGTAIGATFEKFNITYNTNKSSGGLIGKATDCSFRSINIKGSNGNAILSNSTAGESIGGFVDIIKGRSSFDNINISNLTLRGEGNVGLIVGAQEEGVVDISFVNCSIKDSKIELYKQNQNSMNAGAVIGSAKNISINNKDNAKNYEGITIDSNNSATLNVGGLVGSATNVNINSVINNVTINVNTSQEANVGGLVGSAESRLLIQNLENNNISGIDITAISTGTETRVGGIVGNVLEFSMSSLIEVLGTKLKASGNTTYVGGLVGNGSNITISNIDCKLPIIVSGTTTYVGGLVGHMEDGSVKNCSSGNDITLTNDNNTNVIVGGIVGKMENGEIRSNLSYGRIQLKDNTVLTNLNAGGIAGYSENKDTEKGNEISDNISLSSLEFRNRATTTHRVNAILGFGSQNGSGNIYTYQLSLAVESNTTFAKNEAKYTGLSGITEDFAELLSGEDGSVLKPIENPESIEKGKYYYLSDKFTGTLPRNTDSDTDSDTGFVLIGNGHSITQTHIEKISANTIISGVTVEGTFGYDITNKNNITPLNGFIEINNGFVCGVVVKCNYSADSNYGGFVTTNNGAILYSSYNGQAYSTTNNGQADSTTRVAAFVLTNQGIIDYCHATGAVKASTAYSFGANTSTGAITNCYTISHNEGTTTKCVFTNDPDELQNLDYFQKNRYDSVATECNCKLTGLSDDGNMFVLDTSRSRRKDSYWGKGFVRDVLLKKMYNYGYETLCYGPFKNCTHLSIFTGDGLSKAYGISNARMLDLINDFNLFGIYELANNINLACLLAQKDKDGNIKKDDKGNIIYNNFNMIGNEVIPFCGSFNGNNKTISNLNYSEDESESKKEDAKTNLYGGMFGYVSCLLESNENNNLGGKIQDLTLDSATITLTSYGHDGLENPHNTYAGALVGYANGATITNVKVNKATINSNAENEAYAGGLIGFATGSYAVSTCSVSSSSITAENTFAWSDEIYSGIETTKYSGWYGFDSEETAKNYIASSYLICGNDTTGTPQTAYVQRLTMYEFKEGSNVDKWIGKNIAPKTLVVDSADNLNDTIKINNESNRFKYSAKRNNEFNYTKYYINSQTIKIESEKLLSSTDKTFVWGTDLSGTWFPAQGVVKKSNWTKTWISLTSTTNCPEKVTQLKNYGGDPIYYGWWYEIRDVHIMLVPIESGEYVADGSVREANN